MNNPINKFGLTQRDMNVFQGIFHQYPEIQKVYIFGSRAIGNFRQGSDIDLAVMNDGVGSKTLSRIKEAFEESSLPYKVDLIYVPKLKHIELNEHILSFGAIFYERAHL